MEVQSEVEFAPAAAYSSSGKVACGVTTSRGRGAGFPRRPHLGTALHALGRHSGRGRAPRPSHPRLSAHVGFAGCHERRRASHGRAPTRTPPARDRGDVLSTTVRCRAHPTRPPPSSPEPWATEPSSHNMRIPCHFTLSGWTKLRYGICLSAHQLTRPARGVQSSTVAES